MCACVPPPLSRIARRALKARLKHWLGPSDTPPRAARVPTPPQALINRTEIQWRTFSLFLHTYATVLTHWHLIGLIIKFGQ